MSKPGYIEHSGVVDSIEKRHLKIRIVSESACAGCHAKGSCTAADLQDKIVDVFQPEEGFEIGQKVMLVGKSSIGSKAAVLAYVIPIILVLTTLITTFSITAQELLAGVVSLVILVPYYTVIYFLKDKLQQTFSFTVKK